MGTSVNTSARTDANPLFDLATKYGLDLEHVYCYAWRVKRLLIDDRIEKNYWSEAALKGLTAHPAGITAIREIGSIVKDYMLRQGFVVE